MSEHKFKAVIFDIDGTLSLEISWLAFTKGLGASVDDHLKIYKDLKTATVSYEQSKEELLTMWKKTGKANKEFISSLFEKWPLKNEAKEIMSYLKEHGFMTCLITGSIDLYAKIIAKRLEVDNYYANTEFIWDQNGYLADFHYYREQSKKKVEQFLEFCRISNLQPKDCLIVGDDDNDIELFTLTGNGIAVHSPTSEKLEQYSWKKVFNLNELKDIVNI